MNDPKYVQNLIQSGASPHLIAKLSTLPPTKQPVTPVGESEQDTHGKTTPAPAPRRGKTRKA